ncbi:amidase [Stigmatella sp. ncwal1]|uniref:Amidase n=1 Tax=Stigmatella ashevillensis TaxID=2995309 RepID=A0ABT5DNE3_9BACT|nr:amidase [Stigmatella ashevillena]MDC0713897.1 amidase [Stigmatella ashevillena]
MQTQPTELLAHELSQLIHQRQISCREVMQAFLKRIAAVNPTFNAIVSLQDPDGLLRQADERDAQLSRGESMGWMHGIPQAIKDLSATRGIRTTMGSPLMSANVPSRDCVMVERMKGAGALIIGKTNTPEFGLGSQTYNTVFGITRNAWNAALCAGGSSGGSAVALAQRMLPVADGSDMMGSLRNPAAYNNVFGFRPSQGRVPYAPAQDLYVAQLGIEGPMGRSVRDVALLLGTQAGWDARAPLSIGQDGSAFDKPLDPNVAGQRIAWLGDLRGYLAMEPGILELCEQGLRRLETLGCAVEPIPLGFSPEKVWDTWLVWRSWLVAGNLSPFHADPSLWARLKPEAQWEAQKGMNLSGSEVYAASVARSAFYQHLLTLFEHHDFLALPTAQVWPFDANIHWPKSVNGRPMDTYHRWMEVSIYATLGGLPAMNVPVGFNAQGLPMGVQLIGRPQADLEVLRLAAAYEQTLGELLARRPAEVSAPPAPSSKR